MLIHTDYQADNYLTNDIALITLATPITTLIQRGVRAGAIRLPLSALDNPEPRSNAIAIGWGLTTNIDDDADGTSDSTPPRLLRGAVFTVLSVLDCARRADERAQPSKICIDASKKSICSVRRVQTFFFSGNEFFVFAEKFGGEEKKGGERLRYVFRGIVVDLFSDNWRTERTNWLEWPVTLLGSKQCTKNRRECQAEWPTSFGSAENASHGSLFDKFPDIYLQFRDTYIHEFT